MACCFNKRWKFWKRLKMLLRLSWLKDRVRSSYSAILMCWENRGKKHCGYQTRMRQELPTQENDANFIPIWWC